MFAFPKFSPEKADLQYRLNPLNNYIMTGPQTYQIALLETYPSEDRSIDVALRIGGYRTISYSTVDLFLASEQRDQCDLIILRLKPQGLDQLAALSIAMANYCGSIPIIAVVAGLTKTHTLRALSNGASVALSETSEKILLLAHIRAAIRRHKSTVSNYFIGLNIILKINHIRFLDSGNIVYIDNKQINITQKEFSLALFLCLNIGVAVSREELIEEIWNCQLAKDARTVDVHISRIRKRLLMHPKRGLKLSAVYGYGYKLERLVNSQ